MKKFILQISISFALLATIATGFIYLTSETLFAESAEEREERLRDELQKLEEEKAELEKGLNSQKGKSATIQRDVDILTAEIRRAQINIESKNINIRQLGSDIALKDQTVTQLNEKLERSKGALAELIKRTNELDDLSLAEILLAEEDISEFFESIDEYNQIRNSLENLFDEIRELRGLTEEEKESLRIKQERERDIKAEIEAEKRTVEVKEDQKQGLLSASKQVESTYEGIIAEKQARASQIRAALFQLRDTAGISFGDAVDYAQAVSRTTGVRAAFILAILKQESDLGKNVGTCNRPGDPESKKWYNIMPGPNDNSWRDDQTIFKQITKRLGIDPEGTPLSCPFGAGWGGAMGPSQFIPTTWNSYESRIASAVGVSVPNPWNPEHAFTATALYVRDLGASAGGYSAEKTAALKYYAGSNWSLPQNQFYGNSVMNHAVGFQNQIDFLNEVD